MFVKGSINFCLGTKIGHESTIWLGNQKNLNVVQKAYLSKNRGRPPHKKKKKKMGQQELIWGSKSVSQEISQAQTF